MESVTDVEALTALLSGPLSGQLCSLGGRTISPPHSSSPGSASWSEVPMWPKSAPLTADNVSSGLYSLAEGHTLDEAQPLRVCTIVGGRTQLHGGALKLAPHTALVLDSSCKDVHFRNLSISGGLVVCHGAACTTRFSNVHFHGCTVVVLAGAHVTLERTTVQPVKLLLPAIQQAKGLAVFAHGIGTHVVLRDSCIKGVVQGATVQGAARLEAYNITMCAISVVGLEVKDEGSSVKLSECTLSDFTPGTLPQAVRGVYVHSNSSAEMIDVTVSRCMRWGVCISTQATATMSGCTVSETQLQCVLVMCGGTLWATSCTVEDSDAQQGLLCRDEGSSVDASSCVFKNNAGSGVAAGRGATVAVRDCRCSHNKLAGLAVKDQGSVLRVTGGVSMVNQVGLHAFDGGRLAAHNVVVSTSLLQGLSVRSQGVAVLSECCVRRCGMEGLHAQHEGSVLEAEGCTVYRTCLACVHVTCRAKACLKLCELRQSKRSGVLAQHTGTVVDLEQCKLQRNGAFGALAAEGAVVHALRCTSENNVNGGFWAVKSGEMTVSTSFSVGDGNSSADGDQGDDLMGGWAQLMSPPAATGASSAGKLTLDKVFVDGELISGTSHVQSC